MKHSIVKVRNYKNNVSIGLTKEIADFLEKEKHEHFVMNCDERGIITYTPLTLLNDKIAELTKGDKL